MVFCFEQNSRYYISNLRQERSRKAYLQEVLYRMTAVVAFQYMLFSAKSGNSRDGVSVFAVS